MSIDTKILNKIQQMKSSNIESGLYPIIKFDLSQEQKVGLTCKNGNTERFYFIFHYGWLRYRVILFPDYLLVEVLLPLLLGSLLHPNERISKHLDSTDNCPFMEM